MVNITNDIRQKRIPANALRQVFLVELQAHGIILRIDEICEPIGHAQYKEDRRIASNGDLGIAPFYPDQGRFADRRPLHYDRHGKPTPTPGVLDVVTELAQGARDGYR